MSFYLGGSKTKYVKNGGGKGFTVNVFVKYLRRFQSYTSTYKLNSNCHILSNLDTKISSRESFCLEKNVTFSRGG